MPEPPKADMPSGYKRFAKGYCVLPTLLLGVVWPYFIPAFSKPPKIFLALEESEYDKAHTLCSIKNGRMPTLIELIRLERGGLLPHRKTDYWSQTKIHSFAFGWSTRKNMLSFDLQSDRDHVVCIVQP